MIISFYDLTFNNSSGKTLRLADYKNKVLLIVNTATKCGLATQFKQLEQLYQKYKDRGFCIIGFPCNQFLGQEPQSDDTMVTACKINFGVTFQLTQKIDVNGKNTHPVFVYLKKELPGGLFGSKIKWNFTKFLITSNGNPYKRYAPTVQPLKIEEDLLKLLE